MATRHILLVLSLLWGCTESLGGGIPAYPDPEPDPDPDDPDPDDPDDPRDEVCAIAPLAMQTPWAGDVHALPGSIEAEDYDQGGVGVAYLDQTPGNEGYAYRNDDVDVKVVTGGYAVGWWQRDEWLAYTVDVERAGRYRLELRLGSVEPNRTVRVEACGRTIAEAVPVPRVAEWGDFEEVTVDDVELLAGTQVLRVVMGAEDYADFDALELREIAGPEPEPEPEPVAEGFAAVVAGVRPRGVQCETYELTAAGSGDEWFVAIDGDDSASGTRQAPWRTIAHAAQVADAGDVVTIGPGEYTDSVIVEHGGTEDAPLVFQAETCGTVVLTGGGDRTFRAATNGSVWTSCMEHWVTIKGLELRDFAERRGDPGECHGETIAAALCTGWRVEDTRFVRAGDRAIAAYGSDIVVTRTTIIESGGYSIIGAGEGGAHIADLEFSDLVLERNNDLGLLGPACGASVKILFSDRVVVDNVESFGNVGPGWWFDWENWDWEIRNSYFHDNVGRQHTWEGPGVWIEGPGGGGTFENNVMVGNEGAGLGLLETHDHDILGNLFVEDHLELRGIVDGARQLPTNMTALRNQFERTGTYTSIGDWGDTRPQDLGHFWDENTYEIDGTPTFRWGQFEAWSIAEMQELFGFEHAWPPEP